MRRTLSLLLTAALAVTALVCPASAASDPWLEVGGRGSESQQLTLKELPGRHNGVQITLELDRVPAGLSYTYPETGEGSSYPTFRLEGNSLILYVASKLILNQDSSLDMGEITAEESFTVTAASALKLLNVGPNDTQTLIYDRVSINAGGSSSGSSSSGSGSSDSGNGQHSISPAAGIQNGSIRFSDTSARPGDTVTLTALPDPGYVLGSLTVVDNTGREVAVKDLGDGKWSFVMPSAGVTVRASFVREGSGQETALPFLDVTGGDWFYDAVAYVYSNGLMSGTGSNRFGPSTPTTRGMVVTILYSYEGKPEAGLSGFQDVTPDQYYAKPVAWAAANGVVSGFSDTVFGPDRVITREQMAMILYRYAQYKGLDVSGRADLSRYDDADQISGYAQEAVAWANHEGLITGVDSRTILPGGSATRAQVAAILRSFGENVANQ